MATAVSRGFVSWLLAIAGVVGALLGWFGVYAVAASHAAGTADWVGLAFLGSAPASIASIVLARKSPQVEGASQVAGVALFVFVVLCVMILATMLA